MNVSECTTLLLSELSARYHRCLTNDQLCRVAKKCFSCGGPPLLVKLTAALVQTWTSFEADVKRLVECLPTTVDTAIDQILEQIEKRFGRPLVARVLGLLTTSQLGLSDMEMDDVLSLDDAAFDALPDHGSRLPIRCAASASSVSHSFLCKASLTPINFPKFSFYRKETFQKLFLFRRKLSECSFQTLVELESLTCVSFKKRSEINFLKIYF